MIISIGLDPDLIGTMQDFDCTNYVALAPSPGIGVLNYLGDDSVLQNLVNSGFEFFFGFDLPLKRREFDQLFGLKGITLCSKSSLVSEFSEISSGVTISDLAFVGPRCQIRDFVKVGVRSSIHHDTRIDKYSIVGPGAVVCGRVTIGEAVYVGAGSIILPGISISNGVTIGAGAVVTKDIPENACVVGIPAREI